MFKRIGLTLGFTLIEMGIVLVVVGLLLSGGLVAVAPVIASTKASETNQHLDRIEQALNLYVIRYGCLPCPADGSAGTAGGSAGSSAGAYTSKCLTDVASGATCSITNGNAVVPWGTLGLSQNDVTDGWGNLISYVVDGTLALNSTSMKRTGSEYPDGTLVVRDATPTTTVLINSTAAYVLISHGPDSSNARTAGGVTRTNTNGATNLVQEHNGAGLCTAASPCHQDQPYDASGADKFDDIVRWRPAALIIQFCGTNACGNPA